MSNFLVGSFTIASTGDHSISLGFQPKFLRFTVAQLAAGAENANAHFSEGATDGTNEYSHSTLAQNGAFFTRSYSTYCVSHLGVVSNTLTRVISATLKSFDASGFTLTFDRATTDYQIFVEAFA